MKCLYHH